jgi:hypothetical protein
VRVIIPAKGCGIPVDASTSWLEQKWKNETIPASPRFDKVDSCRHQGDWRYSKIRVAKWQTSKYLLYGNAIIGGESQTVSASFRTVVTRLEKVAARQ